MQLRSIIFAIAFASMAMPAQAGAPLKGVGGKANASQTNAGAKAVQHPVVKAKVKDKAKPAAPVSLPKG